MQILWSWRLIRNMWHLRVKTIAAFADLEVIKQWTNKPGQSFQQIPCEKHNSALASGISIFEGTFLV